MRFAAIDTETEMFAPGNMAPPLVCVSTCRSVGDAVGEPELYGHAEGAAAVGALVDEALASPDGDPLILVLQNGPYDWAVLMREIGTLAFARKVFALHAACRVWDTRFGEWVLDCADGVLNLQPWPRSRTGYRRPPKDSGWYSLGRLASKYGVAELDKGEGSVRTNFGWLRGVPLGEWPPEYKHYAMQDAWATLGVLFAQRARAKADPRNVLADLPKQCHAYLALHLISAWGLTTDLPMVAEYRRELETSMERMREGLARIKMRVDGEDLPLLSQKRGKKKPVKDEGKWQTSTKALRALIAAAFEAQGLEVPMTEPSSKFPDGQVATDAETIADCADARLAPWKAYKHEEKMLTTYVPELEKGIVHPGYGFTANGRVTHFSPNIGNLPRKGKVRECYTPRPGHYLLSVDYGSQELVTFGQVMHWTVGPNALSDALNEGMDPHLMLAANRMGIDYDEAMRRRKAGDQLVKDHRQKSKGPNFGYPGGMGPANFVEYMRGQDPPEFYTVDEAEEMRELWFKTWNNDPRRYFRWVTSTVGDGWITQFVSKRVRGGGSFGPGVGFTDGANTFFSGLAADMSKDATIEVVRRCYTEPKSHLWGARVVAFIHDELLVEVPIARDHEAAHEIADIMLASGRKYCPDVKSKAEPALMARWYKNAEPVYADGRLVPWEPEAMAA